MGIGADCPENWNRQESEGSSPNVTHTERVDEEIVLDFVYVPRVRSALRRKIKFSWNRTSNPPYDQLGRYHGVPPVCSEFWKRIQRNEGRCRGGEILPVCCIVLYSFQFCVCHE